MPILLILVLVVTAIVAPQPASAAPPQSDWYAELNAGPAVAIYLPVDEGGKDNEHLVPQGYQLTVGAGYGWEGSALRLDLGLRLQQIKLSIAGSYSLEERDDDFRANYNFIAPGLFSRVITRFDSRLNLYAGLSLGTVTFISDKQGKPLKVRQLPAFGTFEVGALLALTEWLELSASLTWLPPVTNITVFMPAIGLRTRF